MKRTQVYLNIIEHKCTLNENNALF